MGAVGKFVAADSCVYVRDSDVICRTERGLELGQVICELPEADSFDPELDSTDGSILRPTTPAETYDRKVRFKKFAESLAEGCGPDCGTKEGGCSSSGCGSCKLSGSCGK